MKKNYKVESEKKNNQIADGIDNPTEVSSMPCLEAGESHIHPEHCQISIEDIADGFFEINLNGEFIFFNTSLCKIFGRSPKEIKNYKFVDFMDSANALSTARSIRSLYDQNNQSTPMIWEIILKDGQKRTLEVSAHAVSDLNGQITGTRGIIHDITDKIRVQAEILISKEKIEQLYASSQQAEQQSRAFLKFLPIPLLVYKMDHSVAYLNPAFEKTFGWTRADLEKDPFAPIPADHIKKSRTGKASLVKNGVCYGLETKRLTKDGRVLEVIYDGSALYDKENQPNGLVITLRDITQSKKDARTTQALFTIAKALHHSIDLDHCLLFIAQQVQALMTVGHAHIILIDTERHEYYFRAGVMDDSESYDTFSQRRVPLDDVLLGKIILTKKPYTINDISDENDFKVWRSQTSNTRLRNVLGVPMQVENRIIGIMAATNKIDRNFDQDDVDLLSSIANMVALPIENTRINEALRSSYEDIKALNRAKDRIIDHLSHELRTPTSVLSGSLKILAGETAPGRDTVNRVLARSERSLKRIIDMQNKLGDIIRNPDQCVQKSLTALLDLCTDELETLVDLEIGLGAGQRIRQRIDDFFGPHSLKMQHLPLNQFVAAETTQLRGRFAHRGIEFLLENHKDAGFVDLPPEILTKILTGLVRNAVEYTPDGGKVKVLVRAGENGPELVVTDTGVGLTEENQRLISGNYFTTADIYQYGTGNPFDFNAGGRGFDLLRMRVFSERYSFKLLMESQRCPHIPTNEDACPGSTKKCKYCDSAEHCHCSGGTTFTIQFKSER